MKVTTVSAILCVVLLAACSSISKENQALIDLATDSFSSTDCVYYSMGVWKAYDKQYRPYISSIDCELSLVLTKSLNELSNVSLTDYKVSTVVADSRDEHGTFYIEQSDGAGWLEVTAGMDRTDHETLFITLRSADGTVLHLSGPYTEASGLLLVAGYRGFVQTILEATDDALLLTDITRYRPETKAISRGWGAVTRMVIDAVFEESTPVQEASPVFNRQVDFPDGRSFLVDTDQYYIQSAAEDNVYRVEDKDFQAAIDLLD